MIRKLFEALTPALLIVGFISFGDVQAAEQFPYQAVVVGDKVDVRCGPGGNFYVTGIAKANEQVTVHRHDHGGWYMISPPSGSFSLIDAALITRDAGNRGQVTLNPGSSETSRAIVRIGSQVSNENTFYGRELSHGEIVTILGETTIAGPNGPRSMLKIAPPAQEFRWVKGEYLVPMSKQIQQQLAVDPYQIPVQHRQRYVLSTPTEKLEGIEQVSYAQAETPKRTAGLMAPSTEPVTVNTVSTIETSRMPAPDQVVQSAPAISSAENDRKKQDFARLDQLDKSFHAMLAQDPANWDFAEIARGYEELKRVANSHVSYMANERLESVNKRQEVAQRYKRFVQISVETSQRDAQLLSQRPGAQSAQTLEAPVVYQGEGEAYPTMVANSDPGMNLGMTTEGSIPAPTLTVPVEQSSTPLPSGVTPELNGAGILHHVQAPPGFPKYVLVSPDGRMLAYVEPGTGVNLEAWVGKPAGLIGARNREENYGADLIRVNKVVPVKLSK
ncbi:hypothetical protein SH668x_003089 [Planctomicrobium sp. SH668]|uniref:hypothetical protein n=1 Tax=Planctomicrobium sp. SH668 TaxID=3448126 RepID=UPI003F5BC651